MPALFLARACSKTGFDGSPFRKLCSKTTIRLAFCGIVAAAAGLMAEPREAAADVCGLSNTGIEPQSGLAGTANLNALACGINSSASGTFDTAVGGSASTGAGRSLTFISGAVSSATAIGTNSWANGIDATAVGGSNSDPALTSATTGTQAIANFASAFGSHAVASGVSSTAIGDQTRVSGANSTALGASASATFANSTAIGNGATTTRANQQSFGTASNTYTLAGITSAASLAAQTGPVSIVTSDGAGNLATLSSASIASVASVAALDGRVTNLENNVRSLNNDVRKAFEGAAVAIAMGGAALPDNKRFAISANWGNFSGENAFGGVAQMRISNNFVANAAIGAGFNRGGVGGRVGGTFAW
jgi:hypothetical protein